MSTRAALGFDFGTESVRAVLLSLDGAVLASAASRYRHGQILDRLPRPGAQSTARVASTAAATSTGARVVEAGASGGSGASPVALSRGWALQHPGDWLEAAALATRAALREATLAPEAVIGVGVDFTSCTVLPTLADGTPLCLLDAWRARPHAWPKLWKHHGAQRQADDLNEAARERGEPWLARYGGGLGLEWMWPKLLEIYDDDRTVFEACARFIEAGDWFVWRLVGGESPTRSTCQAGYKGCWGGPTSGYPSADFFEAARAGFSAGLSRATPGRLRAPGERAGELTAEAAARLGLRAGTPVSTAIIDAHAAVPGVGAARAGVLVMVLGTSACYMLNAPAPAPIEGVAGIVEGGILPGLTGYEMGQAAVGDAFAWLARLTGQPLASLAEAARSLPPGAEGALCVDWFNGCRTPLMNGALTAQLHGITLETTPAHLYRAVLEGCAMGCRWIVELVREGGVAIDAFIATGGLPSQDPIIAQTFADVLGEPISPHPAPFASASGAAMLGAVAAGGAVTGFDSVEAAVRAMAQPASAPVTPRRETRAVYDALYARYRRHAVAS